ncbi:NADPH:quinone reductase [Tetragenococcus osmophilus]|uniref:Alcohol dehydrogenase n=1 Tax=Tetragenococcus osmophilus TaxID=526944 RepID=A0AA38CY29_9ENTE|nr:YhdH/YhfP family quinone oxidoreductase [Tetragenococcus osmophilus]AYW46984.1 NADPH:quinone reductase [Tetragenococcus osmophilus]GMA55032.1 alcohol dehydrogenase [Alicyclobacillus contaminans]GMA71187.1 alcohol dehydrogenase [Tetragenococcus osmophilus]
MENVLAFEVTQTENVFSRGLVQKQLGTLKKDQVRVQIEYSDINYKDALAATKNGGVVSDYPKVIGIDLAGTVIETNNKNWKTGQKVLVTGYGLGTDKDGGFSQVQDVPGEWLVELPQDLTPKEAMKFGTAGFTAALAVKTLDEKINEKDAPILVTGASGGVASTAIALLHQLGYSNIIALSSKKEQAQWLLKLGATDIQSPAEVLPEKKRPIGKQKFGAVIDTVGGEILANLLPLIQYNGAAILCGNASGIALNTTVLPFILRGIQMIGIDSVYVEMSQRKQIWQFLTENKKVLGQLSYQEVDLTDLDETIDSLLNGTHTGRTIVNMGGTK